MSAILSTSSRPVVTTRQAFRAAVAGAVVVAAVVGSGFGAWLHSRVMLSPAPSALQPQPLPARGAEDVAAKADRRDLLTLLEFRPVPGAEARVSLCNVSAAETVGASTDRRTVAIRALLVRNRPKPGQIDVMPQWSFSYAGTNRNADTSAEFQAGQPVKIGLAGRLEATFSLPPVATQIRLVLLQTDTVIGGAEFSLPARRLSPEGELLTIDGCDG